VIAAVAKFGDDWRLHDGRHRMRAHEIAGRREIEVELIEGEGAVRDGTRVLRRGGT
jgi:hypothetical protein